jgi:hypothetical protein
MHLFLIDLFISIDTLSPLIYLQKKKSIICNINPVQNHKKNYLISLLIDNGSKYKNFLPLNNTKIVFFFLIKILTKFPCIFQKFLYNFYHYIYNQTCFFSEKEIERFFIENQIKSITYEESSPKLYISKIAKCAKKLKIILIKVSSGHIYPFKIHNNTYHLNTDFCNFILLSNNYWRFNKNFSKKKIRFYNAIRYSDFWLSFIKKKLFIKKTKKNKTFVVFFQKFYSGDNDKVNNAIFKIKKNNKYEVLTREKPRELLPLGCNKYENDKFSSSQVIDLSKYIITSRSSSILLEAIKRKKQIIFLKYLNNKLHESPFYKLKAIHKANNENEVLEIIEKKAKLNVIDYKDYDNFLKKYLKFYKKESALISQIKKFYRSF